MAKRGTSQADPLRYERALGDERPHDRDSGEALGTEYLLTNGLGGFALGTALGVPTRRYHGLLIAATNPPVGRVVALHSIAERLVVHAGDRERAHDLFSYEFLRAEGGGEAGANVPMLHPRGHERVQRFVVEQATTSVSVGARRATWTLSLRDADLDRVEIVKQLVLERQTNACTVRYWITLGDGASLPAGVTAELHLRPMTPLRDFHALRRRAACDRYGVETSDASASAHVEIDGLRLELGVEGAAFEDDPQWWYGCFYRAEADRGQDCQEDLFSPGVFVRPIRPGRSGKVECALKATLSVPRIPTTESATGSAGASRALAQTDPALVRLHAAAADFVVRRTAPVRNAAGELVAPASDGAGVSVIAGYPWFSDWGRDTFISLPGLMLHTGRFDDAARTLRTFAACRRKGLIPNVFNDQTGEPEYNTVDASLWYVHAACEHARLSNDDELLRGEVGRACLEVVDHYRRGDAGGPPLSGTFNICMDPFDKLMMAGTEATQLTWMDARRDGVTFTPRHGKPVEINALWYNALRSLSERMASINPTASANMRDLAGAVGASFVKAFWCGDSGAAGTNKGERASGRLFDCLTPLQSEGRHEWVPAREIRPNQLLAVSLPHSPLSKGQQLAVLATVRERLLTPMGVRTLDPADSRYRGRYEGRLFDRDAAYHQGTAWPWLLGVYAIAVLRVGEFSDSARTEARRALEPILAQMDPPKAAAGCLGQIAEVYDGDDPQRPSGCPAQAWSIAVILEAMHLMQSPHRPAAGL